MVIMHEWCALSGITWYFERLVSIAVAVFKEAPAEPGTCTSVAHASHPFSSQCRVTESAMLMV